MKKIYSFAFFLSSFFAAGVAFAQDEVLPCGTTQMFLEQLKQNPELYQQIQQEEIKTQQYLAANTGKKKLVQIYTIPVVFHIIHNYGVENIHDTILQNAIKILNADFRKTADHSAILASFQPIDVDCEIEFKLAQLDPSGNCTNGIDRIASMKTFKADDYSRLNPWPRDKYVNVWVVNDLANNSAGGAYVPAAVVTKPLIDGVIILYNYLGENGLSTPTRSHSLSHEFGHIFNLDHTWGSTNNAGAACGDDGVADTPITKGSVNCNTLNVQVCSPGTVENVQNYMEYSFCHPRMFTADQRDRMQAALNSSVSSRNNLWTNANLIATGTDGTTAVLCKPKADFNANKKIVCLGGSVNFTDYSFNANSVTGWVWSFPGGTPSSSNLQNQSVVYNSPGRHSVSLTTSNASGTGSMVTKTNYITVFDVSNNTGPYNESFESFTFPATSWIVNNPDNYRTWAENTSAAYTGTKSIYIDNMGNNTDNADEAISPGIDMTKITTPTLTFKVAEAQYTAADKDSLKVLVSSNCGQTYAQVYSRFGNTLKTVAPQTSAFVPSSTSQWRTETVNLSGYATKTNLLIKFRFAFQGGNNIYIDDINIGGTVGIDKAFESLFDLNIFPNPSDGQSTVSFYLEKKDRIKLSVYDMIGQEIAVVADTELLSGDHTYPVNTNTTSLGKGIYFVELNVGKERAVKKLVIN